MVCACAGIVAFSTAALASGPPEIRSHPGNRVPVCVTPDALMAFVKTRNSDLAPRFQRIAHTYRELGEAWRIRWDYAFYQMVIETNYLQFRRGDGSPGDVSASQNNFAGIGATGGGVPGDRFPDVRTGVLAQMQHLVAYSGERVAEPAAPRTRAYQGDIIAISAKLGRPVTFGDLARRWAADKAYARSIEIVADLFRRDHCQPQPASVSAAVTPRTALSGIARLGAGTDAPIANEGTGAAAVAPVVAPAPRVAVRPGKAVAPGSSAPQSAVAAGPQKGGRCGLFTASYGGNKVQLIAARHDQLLRVTALTVDAAQSAAMTEAFIAAHAPGGLVVGTFDTLDSALTAGRRVCLQNQG
jgi:hypothetical protein